MFITFMELHLEYHLWVYCHGDRLLEVVIDEDKIEDELEFENEIIWVYSNLLRICASKNPSIKEVVEILTGVNSDIVDYAGGNPLADAERIWCSIPKYECTHFVVSEYGLEEIDNVEEANFTLLINSENESMQFIIPAARAEAYVKVDAYEGGVTGCKYI